MKTINLAIIGAGGYGDYCLGPVSYTHLDVYKRQFQRKSVEAKPYCHSCKLTSLAPASSAMPVIPTCPHG